MVADALIDSSRVNWDEPPALRWQSVILECEKQNTLTRLVPVLLKEYPDNKQLFEACLPWLSEKKADATRKTEVDDAKRKTTHYADLAEEIPVTLESIRMDLAMIAKDISELKRWRKELSTMSAKSLDNGQEEKK